MPELLKRDPYVPLISKEAMQWACAHNNGTDLVDTNRKNNTTQYLLGLKLSSCGKQENQKGI
jgi:hypothetical protein